MSSSLRSVNIGLGLHTRSGLPAHVPRCNAVAVWDVRIRISDYWLAPKQHSLTALLLLRLSMHQCIISVLDIAFRPILCMHNALIYPEIEFSAVWSIREVHRVLTHAVPRLRISACENGTCSYWTSLIAIAPFSLLSVFGKILFKSIWSKKYKYWHQKVCNIQVY